MIAGMVMYIIPTRATAHGLGGRYARAYTLTMHAACWRTHMRLTTSSSPTGDNRPSPPPPPATAIAAGGGGT